MLRFLDGRDEDAMFVLYRDFVLLERSFGLVVPTIGIASTGLDYGIMVLIETSIEVD